MKNENAPAVQEKVPVSGKFRLSFADCPCGALNSLLTGGGMTYFFTKSMGMDEGRAGLVWLLFGIWNAVNDPLFGKQWDAQKAAPAERHAEDGND